MQPETHPKRIGKGSVSFDLWGHSFSTGNPDPCRTMREKWPGGGNAWESGGWTSCGATKTAPLPGVAAPPDRRADVCQAGPLPAHEQGLRSPAADQRKHDPYRDGQSDAALTLSLKENQAFWFLRHALREIATCSQPGQPGRQHSAGLSTGIRKHCDAWWFLESIRQDEQDQQDWGFLLFIL